MALQVILCPSGKFGKKRMREGGNEEGRLSRDFPPVRVEPTEAGEQIALFSRCSDREIATHSGRVLFAPRVRRMR